MPTVKQSSELIIIQKFKNLEMQKCYSSRKELSYQSTPAQCHVLAKQNTFWLYDNGTDHILTSVYINKVVLLTDSSDFATDLVIVAVDTGEVRTLSLVGVVSRISDADGRLDVVRRRTVYAVLR